MEDTIVIRFNNEAIHNNSYQNIYRAICKLANSSSTRCIISNHILDTKTIWITANSIPVTNHHVIHDLNLVCHLSMLHSNMEYCGGISKVPNRTVYKHVVTFIQNFCMEFGISTPTGISHTCIPKDKLSIH